MTITPRTLKGFRDFLPAAMIPRERLMETARNVYRSYGYSPIDTPALEYLEILSGKGSEETDRQMYHFVDQGGREVGMRFDLTVPLARFVAQHVGTLGLPFKRYHLASVWRGENIQRGRYREFLQCDFDIIGTTAVTADIETVLVIHDLMKAIGIDRFTIHLNNRQVLTGLLEHLGLAEKSTLVLRSLDKLAKVGAEKVAQLMVDEAGLTAADADQVLQLSQVTGTNQERLDQVAQIVGDHPFGRAGVGRLREILAGTAAAGVAAERIHVDVSIARGLDYYTGTIVETFLDDLPTIGSVCSGGRYDNLAQLYTRQELPGIGASLGLDRLLAALEELKLLDDASTTAQVLIPFFDESRLHDYLRLAARIRAAGIGVEVYPEPKKLGQQLKYADQKGFRVAVIAGAQEFEGRTCQVKDLAGRTTAHVSMAEGVDELIGAIRQVVR